MASNNAGFVFSDKESKYLKRAATIQDEILHNYINVDEAQLKTDAMQAEMLQAVSKAFKDKRVSCKTLRGYYDRLQGLNYWSLSLTNIDINKGEDKRTAYGFEIVSNLPEINGKTVRTDENPQAFATTNITEQAKLLQIPDGVLYIPHTELHALERLQPVCLYESGNIPKDSAGLWSMKSSPLTDVFSGVGSTALTDKKLQDFGGGSMYEIVSATGVRVYIDKEQYSQLLFTSPNMDKLIKQLNHKAYVNGFKSKTVTLTLDEIQEARGVKDRKELDKSIKAALNGLFAISLEYKREDSTGREFKKRRIIQEADGREGHGRGHSAQYSIT